MNKNIATPLAHCRWLLFSGVLIALALSLALVGCSSTTPVTQAAVPNTTGSPSADAPTAKPAGPSSEVEPFVASGPILVENQVDVLALRGGVISEINADVGTAVQKGQLLARLDDREALAERDAAQAKLKSCEADLNDWEAETGLAQTDLDRAQRMRDAGINTQQDLDHARYKLEGSKYEIEKAQRELDGARDSLRVYELELQKTRIEAPFDGVVARRYVRVGQTASTGDRMFWISAVAPLLVKFSVPERFLGQLKTGELVQVSSISAPGESHRAKIVRVSPIVDPASDSIDVVARIDGKPADLRPGMSANIRVPPPAVPSR